MEKKKKNVKCFRKMKGEINMLYAIKADKEILYVGVTDNPKEEYIRAIRPIGNVIDWEVHFDE